MVNRRLLSLCSAFACLLPLAYAVSVGASESSGGPRRFPNLRGRWVGTYETRQGGTGTLDVEITSNTRRNGRIRGTLQDDASSPSPGPVLRLTGNVTPGGRWQTTARGSGIVSHKTGQLSRDRNTITGNYRDTPGGRGTFVLNRVP